MLKPPFPMTLYANVNAQILPFLQVHVHGGVR